MNILKHIFSRKRSPKVLLVNPPYHRLRGMLSGEIPLGLLYLASTLKRNGFEVKVLNSEEPAPGEPLQSGYLNAFKSYYTYLENKNNHAHPAWIEYIDLLNEYNPDILGFTVTTPSYSLALNMASFAKQHTDALVVFGGPHPTLCYEDVIANDCVDVAIVGEGESAFLRLVKNFEPGSSEYLRKVPSAVYASNGTITVNPVEPLIEDLDTVPYPDYEALVRPSPSELRDRFGVIVSRGCPYRCAFCVDHKLWRNRSRFRKAPYILDEIRHLSKNYHLGHLFFQQDSFLNKRELAKTVASGLIDEEIRIAWSCAARIDQIDEDLIKVLKQSGLINVMLGIESGSQHILDIMNKKITIPQIERCVHLLKDNGIMASGFFMIGVPDETEEDVRKTMEFMERLPLHFRSLSVFTPLPGIDLFDRCVELGLIDKNTDWDKLDFQSPENYFSAFIERKRFAELVEETSILVDRLNAEGS